MISFIFNFIANRYKPFTIMFVFFLMGYGDAKAWLLFESGGMREFTIGLLVVANVAILGYLIWLCKCTSFYIQPRSKAVLVAAMFMAMGATTGYLGIGDSESTEPGLSQSIKSTTISKGERQPMRQIPHPPE